jgi:hypothetical protein
MWLASSAACAVFYGFQVIRPENSMEIFYDPCTRKTLVKPTKAVPAIVCRYCGTKTQDHGRKNCVNCAAPLGV